MGTNGTFRTTCLFWFHTITVRIGTERHVVPHQKKCSNLHTIYAVREPAKCTENAPSNYIPCELDVIRGGFCPDQGTLRKGTFKRYLQKLYPLYSTVFLVAAKSRTLKPLAFAEYCRFDISAFFWYLKRALLYIPKESRSIKTAIFIES